MFFSQVLMPIFIAIVITVLATKGFISLINRSSEHSQKVPMNERWGSMCKWTSLTLATLHFLLFWSLQGLLDGETVGTGIHAVKGLSTSDVKEIEQLLTYSFFTNVGMLISTIACIKISNYENENQDKYREVYFKEKKNAEFKSNWCIISFVISVIGYVINLFNYWMYS